MENNIKIGLLWHSFRSANLGCGALSICSLAILQRAVSSAGMTAQYHVFGTGDETLSYAPEAAIISSTVLRLGDLLTGSRSLKAQFSECDLIFDVSAGDSFTDHYGLKRFIQMILSKRLAAKSGKPLILVPQTIGPFRTLGSHAIARRCLLEAEIIFARDEKSMRLLCSMGLEKTSRLSTDVAFALPGHHNELAQSGQAGKLRVGLNVSALLYGGRFSLPAKMNYPSLIESYIKKLRDQTNIELYLVPHVFADGDLEEDDLALAQELAAKYPFLKLPKRFQSPSEAKAFIGTLDLLIASRMHAVIAALASGKAALALGYSRKFTGLLRGLRYYHIADLSKVSEAECLVMLDKILCDLPEATAQASSAYALALQRLNVYENFVHARIEKLAERLRGGNTA